MISWWWVLGLLLLVLVLYLAWAAKCDFDGVAKAKDLYKFFGADYSYYSGKVRPYLRYKGIPYVEINPSVFIIHGIIVPRTTVLFVPVVITPDDIALQDSTEIIDFLEKRFDSPQTSIYPSAYASPKQHLVALLIELYCDEHLIITSMHYRWNFPQFNQPFIYGEFGKMAFPFLPRFLQIFLGRFICSRFRDFVPRLGVTPKSIDAIEQWFEKDFLMHLNKHFEKYPYLLGYKPSMGDFGLMGALFAHIFRDPYSGALLHRIAPNVVHYVERMNRLPESKSGESSDTTVNFLPNDEIPEDVLPILRRMFREFFPVMKSTAEKLEKWMEGRKSGEEIPRILGDHDMTIGDVTEKCAVRAYGVWMLQRPLLYYQSLPEPQKKQVDELLHDVDGYEAMQLKLKRLVKRHNNRFVLE